MKSPPTGRVALLLVLGVVGIGATVYFKHYHNRPPSEVWTTKVLSKGDTKVDGLANESPVTKAVVMPEWAQFQGPQRNGAAPASKLLTSWPAEGPKQLWSHPVGPGFGGAAIRDKQVYILDRRDDELDILRCFDLDNGKELWTWENKSPGRTSYNGSRSVPTVGPKRVYCAGQMGDLYAIDRSTHKLAWTQSIQKDFAGRPGFGFSQSPLLVGDLVVVSPMTGKVGLVAYHSASGKKRWQTESLGPPGYVSPTYVTIAGQPQILFSSAGGCYGINLDDGKTLWSYPYKVSTPIPFPSLLPNDLLFLTAGYNAGSRLIQVVKKEGSFAVKELFEIKVKGSQIHPALFYKGHLYANFNQNSNVKRRPDGLVCIDLKGQVKWQTKDKPNIERGPLIRLGDKLLVLGGEDGVLRLIEPNPEKYQELASAAVFKKTLRKRNNQIWAPMAFSDGRLVLRNQKELVCLDLRP